MSFWVIICPNRSCWAVNGGPIVIHNEHSATVSPYFVLVTIVATIHEPSWESLRETDSAMLSIWRRYEMSIFFTRKNISDQNVHSQYWNVNILGSKISLRKSVLKSEGGPWGAN